MALKIFVTGTDTNVGKTHISVGLIKSFNRLRYATLGLKPLATGCINKGGTLYSEDAIALQNVSSIALDYHYINPVAFEAPIAPHIAAAQTQYSLSADLLMSQLSYALNYSADVHIVEGVGGWLVPLNTKQTMADFVVQCQLSVIVVIDLRLGCLNHALLTINAIKHSHAPLIGWIANCIEPNQPNVVELINTLNHWLPAPCLGIVGYQEHAENIIDPLWIAKIVNTR
jgi:dethiobiotin synthetase